MVDIAIASGYTVAGVVDSDYYGNTESICNVPVIGNEDTWNYDNYVYFNAVNASPLTTDTHTRNNLKRQKIQDIIDQKKLSCVNLLHSTAVIANTVTLGQGIMVCAGAIVSNYAVLNNHCQIREQSYVAHNASIGCGAVLQVQSYVGANISVGHDCYIAIKGTVLSGKDSTYCLAPNEFVRSCERRVV